MFNIFKKYMNDNLKIVLHNFKILKKTTINLTENQATTYFF